MVKERVSNKASWKHFWSSSEKKKVGKTRFGPVLTEAEINALVDNFTPGNTKEELLILKF